MVVFVSSEPSKAQVRRGDEVLGETPAVLEFPHDTTDAVTLTIVKEKYKPQDITFVPKDKSAQAVKLKRDRSSKKRDRKKKGTGIID